jgi:hypothetical protein
MAVLTALVAVTVAAAAPTTTTAATTGDWQSFTPGSVWTDAQCTDLANPTEPTAASCQALCDNTPSCTAINAMTGKAGGCALRACPCGQHLLPAGENKPFTPYMRMSCNDAPPPPPPPPSFARVFGSEMVLQRAPLQARLFGYAAPNSTLTVSMSQEQVLNSSGRPPPFNATMRADAVGHWACLLPPTPAGGPYTISLHPSSARLPQAPVPPAPATTLSGVLFGE